jgi:UDP-glucose 4-epimerase
MTFSFKDKKILVTGGAGYIGSHTVVQLLDAGAEVIILDNLSNSKSEVLNQIEKITGARPVFFMGDVRDRTLVKSIFNSYQIDSVIHFAGLKAVGDSIQKPFEYYDNNVNGSLVLFEEMLRSKVKNLVFSSSATVYGDPALVPIKEDFPLQPTHPYGRSKLIIEDVLRDLHRSDSSWNIALLRYFNPVGAHESGLIGEEPNGIPNNLMPYLAQVAIGKLEKLLVFGNDYPTKDGTGVRDYIHVDDLARGHLAAIDALETNDELIAVNLGTGRGYSVLEIIEAFEKASGRSIPYEIVKRRHGDVAVSYSNSDKAKKLLGWVAMHDLNRMCVDVWRWQSKN